MYAKMRRLLAALFLVVFKTAVGISLPANYDVVWTTPSQVNGSASSMPVGGGDIGLNTWAENGSIYFYVAKSGTFDENNSLLKLGRVRLSFDPNPFTVNESAFEQRLVINDGFVQFSGANASRLRLWVDVYNPVIHADFQSDVAVSLRASLESWRSSDHLMSTEERSQSSWQGYPNVSAVTYQDNVAYFNNGVLSYHRNRAETVFDATVRQQGLDAYSSTMYNPLAGNIFGLWLSGSNMSQANTTAGSYVNTSHVSWDLSSDTRNDVFNITIVAHQNQSVSLEQWQNQLEARIANLSSNAADSVDWWHAFWDRSHIFVNPNNTSASKETDEADQSFRVGRNYQLFRYMLGCNAFGEWPTRFNGGLFTFDPYFVGDTYNYSSDFRLWSGGTFTAQNQRLVYWPLLKSGDIDLMKSQFDFYSRITATNQLRGQTYYGINHTFFAEQVDNFGLPQIFQFNADTYIFNSTRPATFPPGVEFNEWLVWLQDTCLEFAQMILDANQFYDYDVGPYLQFIENSLIWFDAFYQQQQQMREVFPLTGKKGNESLVLYPGSGCETYKDAYNPSSTISGLRAVLTRLLQVDPEYQIGNASYYQSFLARIPATPLRVQQNRTTIAPAVAYSRIQNVEIPQLYPVFPWAEFGLGLPNLSYAIDTYLYDTETQDFHGFEGWRQDGIWLARMGLTNMAKNITVLKLQDSQSQRFPAFWGPGFDWTPDHNHGGSGMIGLQEMLLQTYGNESRTLRILPSWPSDWDVDFKLHAPFNTVVEGVVRGGNLTELKVTPEDRMADVVIGQ